MNETPNPTRENVWPEVLMPPEMSSHPDWARAIQERAATQFRQNGLPDRKTEAWKYTPTQLITALDPAALPGEFPPRAELFPEPLIAADIA